MTLECSTEGRGRLSPKASVEPRARLESRVQNQIGNAEALGKFGSIAVRIGRRRSEQRVSCRYGVRRGSAAKARVAGAVRDHVERTEERPALPVSRRVAAD